MALTTSLAFPVSFAESDERSGIYSLLRQHNPRGSMTCAGPAPTAAGNKLRAVRKEVLVQPSLLRRQLQLRWLQQEVQEGFSASSGCVAMLRA
ncbi:Stigma-specific protein, Stig1 [Musa troglodytarum]|uniref:Stigma-specific protein, Stig1 n=1 Tax=Musa troglodytarum TaxID=320322 RepID=A0A9E7FW98_9LILI|nr:Stigma-specific protein, Stig1 [Musa troglodytarum]